VLLKVLLTSLFRYNFTENLNRILYQGAWRYQVLDISFKLNVYSTVRFRVLTLALYTLQLDQPSSHITFVNRHWNRYSSQTPFQIGTSNFSVSWSSMRKACISSFYQWHVLYSLSKPNLYDFLYVTNFIWPYLYQFFIDFHSLNSYGKPLKRPFNRY